MRTCTHFNQNIPCGSRVMAFSLTADGWTDGRTDSHSDYGAHMRVGQYRNEPHIRTCRPFLYKNLYTCNMKLEPGYFLIIDDDDDQRRRRRRTILILYMSKYCKRKLYHLYQLLHDISRGVQGLH